MSQDSAGQERADDIDTGTQPDTDLEAADDVEAAEAAEPGDVQVSSRRPSRPGLRRAAIVIATLCLLLGFGLAVQVRQNASSDDLSGASQEDLVRILDDLDNRDQRLRAEIAELQDTKDELANGENQAQAAQAEAQKRAARLAILAGTVAAKGPGIKVTITDPAGQVPPETILDAIQELRAAGAEAIQLGTVRIGVTSAVTGTAGDISIDGTALTAPYEILAIGDPQTMSAAMNIPGGVVASVKVAGGEAGVTEPAEVLITALRDPKTPDYAQPAPPSK